MGTQQPLQIQEDTSILDSHETSISPSSYSVTQDIGRREVRPPLCYGFDKMVTYALSIAKGTIQDESRSYTKAVTSHEGEK